MTITNRVQGAYFDLEAEDTSLKLIRLAPNAPPSKGPTRRQGTPWTHDEHERFLEAMEKYPSGPWKRIAAHVGTRNTRQTMTHAQKYRQKIARWKRASQTATTPSTEEQTPIDTNHMAGDELELSLEDLSVEESEIWQSILEIDFDSADPDLQFPDSLAELLNDYEPLQLAQDAEMAEIDEQLAQFL